MQTKRTQTQVVTIVATLAVLWIVRIILAQAAFAAQAVEDSPVWLAPALQAGADIAGGILSLAILAAIGLALLTYGRKLVAWFTALINAEPEPAAGTDAGKLNEAGRVRAVTRSLAQTVEDLDRRGSDSRDLLDATQAQAGALVELAKQMARTASEHAQRAASFNQALDAIAASDPLQIARAAGQVRDSHIRNLLLMPWGQADESYWTAAANLIATQVGASLRWQTEYSQVAVNLLAEIATIKAGILALEANIDAATSARPLLQARVNLDQAGRYLRLGSGEDASPSRLFRPMNEYTLMGGDQ